MAVSSGVTLAAASTPTTRPPNCEAMTPQANKIAYLKSPDNRSGMAFASFDDDTVILSVAHVPMGPVDGERPIEIDLSADELASMAPWVSFCEITRADAIAEYRAAMASGWTLEETATRPAKPAPFADAIEPTAEQSRAAQARMERDAANRTEPVPPSPVYPYRGQHTVNGRVIRLWLAEYKRPGRPPSITRKLRIVTAEGYTLQGTCPKPIWDRAIPVEIGDTVRFDVRDATPGDLAGWAFYSRPKIERYQGIMKRSGSGQGFDDPQDW